MMELPGFLEDHSEVSAGWCCFALAWMSCGEQGADTRRLKAFKFGEIQVHPSRDWQLWPYYF